MGLSFFAPLLLGGMGLIVIPWLVHQIRRPERETMLFSSLMFVPDIKKKVIERQSLQHILLMLLRMGCLVLLALAFSRPYRSFTLLAKQQDSTNAWHVILFDISASMDAGERLQSARQEAIQILDSLQENDRAAFVVFDRTPTVSVPFPREGESQSASRQRIRQAIEEVTTSFQTTSFLPALQKAQDLFPASLLNHRSGDNRLIVHLVSDLQKAGLPSQDTHWKFSPHIEFRPVLVGENDQNTFSIRDVAVHRTPSRGVRIWGQVKNNTKHESSCTVHLLVEEQVKDSRTLTIPPGNVSKVSFSFDSPPEKLLTGMLQTDRDDYPLDNQRYFAWTPPLKKKVWLVAQNENSQQWPPSWFLSRALQINHNRLWSVETIQADDLSSKLDTNLQPDMILLCGMQGLTHAMTESVLSFVQEGGGLWIMLDESMQDADAAAGLLSPLHLQTAGKRYPQNRKRSRETFSWVDFDHSIFFPFQGSRYNDFTSLYFTNYIVVQALEGFANSRGRIIARFEDEHPAMIDIPFQKGHVMLWAFPPDVRWTNLPKSPRFVPLVFETLLSLSPIQEIRRTFLVGETISQPLTKLTGDQGWTVMLPGEDIFRPIQVSSLQQRPMLLQQPGFMTWKWPAMKWVSAVNIDPRESDFTPYPPDQFLFKFVSTVPRSSNPPLDLSSQPEDTVIHREWGRFFLYVFLIVLMGESLYASLLAHKTIHAEKP